MHAVMIALRWCHCKLFDGGHVCGHGLEALGSIVIPVECGQLHGLHEFGCRDAACCQLLIAGQVDMGQ